MGSEANLGLKVILGLSLVCALLVLVIWIWDNRMWRGAKLGLKASLGLSLVYAVLVLLISDTRNIIFLILPQADLFIFIFAIGPAMLYGTITGAILEGLANRLQNKFSVHAFIMISILLCLVIAILSHYLFAIQPDFTGKNMIEPDDSDSRYGRLLETQFFETYPFYIGVPTLIYVIMGGWAGGRLYRKAREAV
ncbi:MAG: hypothetical protein WCF84_16230 [Anaerolineae bacterium]